MLVSAGVVLGAALGLSFAPAVVAVFSDGWISFAGSILGGIIGGGLTVFAGFLAWVGVQEQNELTREALAFNASEARSTRIREAEFARQHANNAEHFLEYVLDCSHDETGPHEFTEQLRAACENARIAAGFTYLANTQAQKIAFGALAGQEIRLRIAIDSEFDWDEKRDAADDLQQNLVKFGRFLTDYIALTNHVSVPNPG